MTSFAACLKSLGFDSYSAYLVSDLWYAIRCRVMEKYGRCCVVCKRTATQVHHTDYEPDTMRGDRIDGLVAICYAHHQEIEWDHLTKCRLWEANRKLRRLIRGHTPKKEVPKQPRCTICLKNLCKRGKTVCRGCVKPVSSKKRRRKGKPPRTKG